MTTSSLSLDSQSVESNETTVHNGSSSYVVSQLGGGGSTDLEVKVPDGSGDFTWESIITVSPNSPFQIVLPIGWIVRLNATAATGTFRSSFEPVGGY